MINGKQKYNLNDGHFIDWLGIGSHKLSYNLQIIILSIMQQHSIVNMIPDMSVKVAYNSLVKFLKKPPISQNTLKKSLAISIVDWPHHLYDPTKGSSLQIFQYKILNNVLFLNNKLFKFGQAQSPLCSLCKRENETTKHLFSQCFITRMLLEVG